MIFAPASTSQDSVALLYKLLTTTDEPIVTRMYSQAATRREIRHHDAVRDWLYKNVRPFDYGIVPDEAHRQYLDTKSEVDDKLYNIAMDANAFRADKIAMGFNAGNWSTPNWFFKSEETFEELYKYKPKKKSERKPRHHTGQLASTIFNEVTRIPVIWPFMADKSKRDEAWGRWQTYESIPKELLKLTPWRCYGREYMMGRSEQPCWSTDCRFCVMMSWYLDRKKKGWTAYQCDEEVMRVGRFGRYWDPTVDTYENLLATRYKVYDDHKSNLLDVE